MPQPPHSWWHSKSNFRIARLHQFRDPVGACGQCPSTVSNWDRSQHSQWMGRSQHSQCLGPLTAQSVLGAALITACARGRSHQSVEHILHTLFDPFPHVSSCPRCCDALCPPTDRPLLPFALSRNRALHHSYFKAKYSLANHMSLREKLALKTLVFGSI